MQIYSLAAVSLAVLSFAAAAPRPAFADTKPRISGPHTHKNLTVYFIHGVSTSGPVPLTLQEALDKGSVRVLETGTVNELKIENTGEEEIFIQSGDIVKGGKQDRVLRMSFVLPPKSGAVPIAAFCVEAGRWAARGSESVAAFASASEAMPSREAKLAMSAPTVTTASLPPETGAVSQSAAAADAVHARQQEVWASVAATQSKLSEQLAAPVASPRSATSLQLSLENKELKAARAAYMQALEPLAESADDIIGYVFAVDGKVHSADVYPSNALFRKMWEKQLAAGVTEAIATGGTGPVVPPSADGVAKFLATAEKGASQEETVNTLASREIRDADKALFVEARRADGVWVHRNYLAK